MSGEYPDEEKALRPTQVNDNPTPVKAYHSLSQLGHSRKYHGPNVWHLWMHTQIHETRLNWQYVKEECVWISGMSLGKGGFFQL